MFLNTLLWSGKRLRFHYLQGHFVLMSVFYVPFIPYPSCPTPSGKFTSPVASTSRRPVSLHLRGMLFIISCCHCKSALCRGFSRKSDVIFSSGKFCMSRFPDLTLYFTNKYLTFVCQVRLPFYDLPFTSIL